MPFTPPRSAARLVAIDASDHQWPIPVHEQANGLRVLFEQIGGSRDQHELINRRGVDSGLTMFRRTYQAERARLAVELALADDSKAGQEFDPVPSMKFGACKASSRSAGSRIRPVEFRPLA